MGKFRLLIMMIISFNFLACSHTKNADIGGDDVTEEFLSEYNGTLVESSSSTINSGGEKLVIHRDGNIEVLQHRNVGETNNPVMPNPTYCSFWLKGEISYVSQLSNDARMRTNSQGQTYYIPETHNMVFAVYQVDLSDELEAGSTTSRGCLAFKEKMSGFLPVYTFGMELFGQGTIRLHTQDSDRYQGGERTESTLDEVYIRQ